MIDYSGIHKFKSIRNLFLVDNIFGDCDKCLTRISEKENLSSIRMYIISSKFTWSFIKRNIIQYIRTINVRETLYKSEDTCIIF